MMNKVAVIKLATQKEERKCKIPDTMNDEHTRELNATQQEILLELFLRKLMSKQGQQEINLDCIRTSIIWQD